MSLRDQIKLEGLTLEEGESTRIVCPSCGGGSDGETSLSLTRTDIGILYNCYRAHCSCRGAVTIYDRLEAREAEGEKPKPKKKKPLIFKEPTEELPKPMASYLLKRFGTSLDYMKLNGIKWCPTQERVIMPVFAPAGHEIAINSRRYDHLTEKREGPKSILYNVSDDFPLIHFPRFTQSVMTYRTIILVEDQWSALKSRLFLPSCALLGTEIHEETVELFSVLGVRHIILALDEDATQKALQHKLKYQVYFDSFTVLPLEKDIKDMPLRETQEMLTPYLEG